MTIVTVDNKNTEAKYRRLSLRELVGSVFAAAIGVQSDANRARDFEHGSARQYVIAGLVATLLFVLAVYTGVKIIVHLATG